MLTDLPKSKWIGRCQAPLSPVPTQALGRALLLINNMNDMIWNREKNKLEIDVFFLTIYKIDMIKQLSSYVQLKIELLSKDFPYWKRHDIYWVGEMRTLN